MPISPAANQIIRHCKRDGHCLQKTIRVAASGNAKILFFLQPGDEPVPPRVAIEAVTSGWLAPLDPGLLDDPLLAQTWSFRARPAAGRTANGRRKEMAKFSIEIKTHTPVRSNTMLGFIDVIVPELRMLFFDLTVHQKDNSRWVGMPARAQLEKETGQVVRDGRGKIAYVPTIGFTDIATKNAFSNRTIEALLEFDRTIFDEATT